MEITINNSNFGYDPKIVEMLQNDQYLQAVKYVKDNNPQLSLSSAKAQVDEIKKSLIANGVDIKKKENSGCASMVLILFALTIGLSFTISLF